MTRNANRPPQYVASNYSVYEFNVVHIVLLSYRHDLIKETILFTIRSHWIEVRGINVVWSTLTPLLVGRKSIQRQRLWWCRADGSAGKQSGIARLCAVWQRRGHSCHPYVIVCILNISLVWSGSTGHVGYTDSLAGMWRPISQWHHVTKWLKYVSNAGQFGTGKYTMYAPK